MVIEPKNKHFLNLCHPDLLLAKNLIYQPHGLILENLKIEDESIDYGAAEFILKNRTIKFRVGKITPTKIGQFVTFWKRIDKGPILPYDLNDSFDFLVVNVRVENQLGQFIFPKKVLSENGIVSTGEKEGKRALRIYPPWDKAENSQAKKTQAWQLLYFIKFSEESNFNISHFLHLLDIA